MARSSHGRTAGALSAPKPSATGNPREEPISDLTVVRLNDPEENEPLVPWPPPGGLARDEDPFVPAPREEAEPLPRFLASKEEAPPARRFRFGREEGVAASLIVHVVLVILMIVWPEKPAPKRLEDIPDPLGIVKLLSPSPREEPIDVRFVPAPGPKAPVAPKTPALSDLDRVAKGGDKLLAPALAPKAVPKEGIRDLAEGPSAPAPALAQAPTSGVRAPSADRTPTDLSESSTKQLQPVRGPLSGLPRSALDALTAEKAARAARSSSPAAGDEGAGFESEGGFVDSGPLSFDTANYDWGAYAAEMLRKIKRNWDVPELARYGLKGRLTIRFFIRKDGTVEGMRILQTSGIPPYDNAAFQAIAKSNPFRSLPDDLGKDREGVTITFFYNIRPEDEGVPDLRPRRKS